MAEFILTGFGDEIDAALDVQMDVMEKLDIHYIETRGIDGKNIADYAPAEAKAVFARMQARGFGVSALGSPIGKISIRDPFLPYLDSFRNLLDVAHAMQTQYIRIFSFFLPECEPAETFRDEVLERLGRNALMVGDRCFDIRGARANGIDAAGILHGFGSEAELRESGATFLVRGAADLRALIIEAE